jgi:hypothetical protein
MLRKIVIFVSIAVVTSLFSFTANAQNRKSVSASEVNGTYRFNFTGKYKGSSNEIKMLALGKGKVKIYFDLLYPYSLENGEIMVNMGFASGIAKIEADEAVYIQKDEYSDDQCEIRIKFVKPGKIEVTDLTFGLGCGFGHKVSAGGVYRKSNSKKPVFDEME